MTEVIQQLSPGICACRLRARLVESCKKGIGSNSDISAEVCMNIGGSFIYRCGVPGCPKIITYSLSINNGEIDEKTAFPFNKSGNCLLNS